MKKSGRTVAVLLIGTMLLIPSGILNVYAEPYEDDSRIQYEYSYSGDEQSSNDDEYSDESQTSDDASEDDYSSDDTQDSISDEDSDTDSSEDPVSDNSDEENTEYDNDQETDNSEDEADSGVSDDKESEQSEKTDIEDGDDDISADEGSKTVGLLHDPFEWMNQMHTVIPADKKGYVSPATKRDIEEKLRQDEESRYEMEQTSKAEDHLRSIPPVPEDEISQDMAAVAARNESNSFLVGVIIWSLIGIIITVILIILLNAKGGGNSGPETGLYRRKQNHAAQGKYARNRFR